jgi:hypothetical protein
MSKFINEGFGCSKITSDSPACARARRFFFSSHSILLYQTIVLKLLILDVLKILIPLKILTLLIFLFTNTLTT